jgi:hypothetical protein
VESKHTNRCRQEVQPSQATKNNQQRTMLLSRKNH